MKINGWDEKMSSKNGGGAWGFDDIDLITRLRESGVNSLQGDFSVIHQWHERPPQSVQDSWQPNEIIMNNKKDETGAYKKEFIKANQNTPWGINDGTLEEI